MRYAGAGLLLDWAWVQDSAKFMGGGTRHCRKRRRKEVGGGKAIKFKVFGNVYESCCHTASQ